LGKKNLWGRESQAKRHAPGDLQHFRDEGKQQKTTRNEKSKAPTTKKKKNQCRGREAIPNEAFGPKGILQGI